MGLHGLSSRVAPAPCRRLQAWHGSQTARRRPLTPPQASGASRQEAAASAAPAVPAAHPRSAAAAAAAAPAHQHAPTPGAAKLHTPPTAPSLVPRHGSSSSSRAAAGGPHPPEAATSAAAELFAPAPTSAAEAEAEAAAATLASAAGGRSLLRLDGETVGKLCLLTVAVLWGSYAPMLRLLYSQDGPPGPVAIMLFRGVLQAGVLVTAYTLATRNGSSSGSSEGAGSAPMAAAAAGPATAAAKQQHEGEQDGDGEGSLSLVPPLVQRIASRVPFTAIAATELGLWIFLATAIQTLGLQLTTATRASFLIQATALLTPVLASFTGEKPSRNVWLGCLVALAGCLCIAADASATDADDGALFSLGGDAAILSSAFFYSLATVRLGTYARHIPSVELAAAKSVVLGGAALFTFLVAAGGMAAAGQPITDLWPGYASPVAWAVLVWSALGPGALAAFLHAKGQSVVPPAEAQVIFSTVPLWSVAFAFLLLGGEPMSEKTWIGGAAVVAAGLIASRKPEEAADAAVAVAVADRGAGKDGKQA